MQDQAFFFGNDQVNYLLEIYDIQVGDDPANHSCFSIEHDE